MSRLFVLVFALLLPFQFAWAGAAVYCQHEGPSESSTGAPHFGHHSHVHTEADGTQKKTAGGAGKLVADGDCGVCHAAGASLLGASTRQPAGASAAAPWLRQAAGPPTSAPARAPDRPQWPRLA